MQINQNKKWYYFVSVLVILSMILSACSTTAALTETADETETASGEQNTGSIESTEEILTDEPIVGGTLVIGLTSEPDTLDPDMTTMGLILDYTGVALIAKDKDNQYVPWAAESWEVSTDGLTYTFKLRQDMKFQDGSPLTAKDFAYTYKRALDPGSTGATSQMLAGVSDITAPDDYTLVITLGSPNFYLLDNLTLVDYMQPVSEAWVNSQGDALGHNPLSTGPYKLKEYVTGDHVTLERNADYTWAPTYAHQGPAYIQEIIFRFIPEISTMVAGLEAGEIDYIEALDVQYISRLEDLGTFNILEGTYQGCNPYLSINVAKAPFDDVKVRQAIAYAIDKQAIIDVVLQGKGTVQSGPLATSMTGYWSGIEDIGYTYDVEKAKNLLTEAGYTENTDGIMANGDQLLQIDLMTSPDYIKVAQMIQEQLKLIGVEINIVQEEFALMVTDLLQGNYSLAMFTYGYSNGGILPILFHSSMEGIMNPGHVMDAELDTLLNEINSETDIVKQQEFLNQAQKMIIEKAYMLPLFSATTYYPLSTKVKNFTFSTKNDDLYLEDAYIQQ